ncbi:sensor histidine kinase [Leptolyngbya sp. NIES-2104]|uniref:sensor histidine kinase n=1 Tax=Leptolyngbya sp. NIES-2104 TaxID=1552121 RepID=UPI0006ECC4DB|nr:PAS domain S-box protein [Leptolyngbya sp. NIES-2104]GAP95510.1 two-component hybrid sensor and regulator [Leptolyngbya sp. NIES-2104]
MVLDAGLMKRSLSRQLKFSFGFTLLLLLLNAIASYRNILKLAENEQAVSRSNQAIANLEATLSTLKDAETGQRGYLLTGQERYLEPYKSAIALINQRVQALEQSGTLEPSRIQKLEQSIARKLAELDQTIQVRRTQGLNAALQIVQLDRGKQIMDEIREQISAIEAEKYQQLQQRRNESQRSLNATLLTFTLVTGTSLVLLALVASGFKRYEIEQDQAEQTLREREGRLQLFVKYAPVSLAMFDRELHYIAVSQRWIDEYHLESIESVLGKTHYELFPNLPERWKSAHQKGLTGESVKCDIDQHVLPDGTEQFLRWEVQPWRDAAGTVSGILISVEDITAQEQIEAELRESEEQFRATFNQAAVGIAHVSPTGAWLRTNQKLCEIVGYPCSELRHLTFQDITHPDDLDLDLKYVRQMLAGEIQTYSMEKRYIRKDRSMIWINLTVALVRESDGSPKYFISVVEDISDRKKVEFELQHLNESLEQRIEQRTEQLTEINQELEAFTYTVSHDLRAPLRIMQGFSQALEEDYGDQLDEVATSYIQSISESAVQMDDLIHDLLSYSRLSRTQIELRSTDLHEAIATALQQLDALISEKQAVIEVPASLPAVIAHRSTLIQVIVNLIGNGIKFVEPEVQPIVKIFAQIEKNSVRLSFEDNGIGIADKYHDRIFGVFERLHGIEAFPGTAIGLAIVRKGIDRMGGKVGLESQLDHGSRFWISLPVATHNESNHDSASHSAY